MHIKLSSDGFLFHFPFISPCGGGVLGGQTKSQRAQATTPSVRPSYPLGRIMQASADPPQYIQHKHS